MDSSTVSILIFLSIFLHLLFACVFSLIVSLQTRSLSQMSARCVAARSWTVSVFICVFLGCALLAHSEEKYVQIFSDRYAFAGQPQLAFPTINVPNIVQIVSGNVAGVDTLYLVSDSALYYWRGDLKRADRVNVDPGVAPNSRVVLVGDRGLIIVTPHAADWYYCSSHNSCGRVGSVGFEFGAIHSAVAGVRLWIGSAKGLFHVTLGGGSIVKVDAIPDAINAVVYSPKTNTIVAGSNGRLWRNLDTDILGKWRFDRTLASMDYHITGLAFRDDGYLFISNWAAINALELDGRFTRSGLKEGLPMRNSTCLSWQPFGQGNGLWIGGLHGVALRQPQFKSSVYGEWRYFAGPAFLPSGPVVAIHAWATQDLVFAATKTGLAIFRWQMWTLAEKAAFLEAQQRPVFDREGLIPDVHLKRAGDMTSYEYGAGDNDGLVTSIYLSSQCYRWATTKEPAAKANAWRAFYGMEKLFQVTGVKGLMARTFWKGTSPPYPHPDWHNSTTTPGYFWKGDTSSDETTGHMLAYQLMFDFVAETPQEKARVGDLILNFVDYVMANNWKLIDVTGKPTTWGFWGPTELNDVEDNFAERGVNALQILQHLQAAYCVSGNPKYLNAINTLAYEHEYLMNIVNEKVDNPIEWNYNDDHLTYLPYAGIFAAPTRCQMPAPALELIRLGLRRHYDWTKPTHHSLYVFISALGLGTGYVTTSDAITQLQRWTTQPVNWAFKNSDRLDTFINPEREPVHDRAKEGMMVLSPDENGMKNFGHSPYHLDGDETSAEAADFGPFLFSYWFARFYKFIV